MAKFFDAINDGHAAFIRSQPLFFVATAPEDGRINLSPKGLEGTFAILSPTRVAFLNLTGSGNETAAHLLQNGRITVMFCAFEGKPLILRLYGRGRVVGPRDAEWAALDGQFTAHPGKRQIVVVEVDSVNSSCGFSVPLMEFQAQRTVLTDWAAGKGEDGIADYQRSRNARSFDGLPTDIMAE